jgi:hypothetical protein
MITKWTISLLANRKWTIQGPLEAFVDLPPDAEDGENVASVKNPPKPHQWVIKRHSGEGQAYMYVNDPVSSHFFFLSKSALENLFSVPTRLVLESSGGK